MTEWEKDGGRRYPDRWPWWLDLENSIYRPLMLIALPAALNAALVLADGALFLSPMATLILLGVVDGGYLFGLLFELIRAAMRRPLFYERLSRTRLVSTLPVPEKK